MEKAVPWALLLEPLESHYPTSGRRGRQPMPLLAMLRIHCMQQWFSFSYRQMEDAVYEIESVRRFAGFGGVTDALPDETTILNFRHFLEDNGLTTVLLETINAHLKANGLLVSKGTMVDATIIHAPSSTKNQDKARDPDMHSKPKRVTSGIWDENPHRRRRQLRRGAQRHRDFGQHRRHHRTAQLAAQGRRSGVRRRRLHQRRIQARRPPPGDALVRQRQTQTEQEPVFKQKKRNRKQSSVRARVEHIFRIIKCQFGFPQDPLPWLGEERLASQLAGRLSESVPAQEAIGRRLG